MKACELCKGEAALHCEADAAFLCWDCDARVHGANFLVARHVRRVTCAGCRSLAGARTVSGAGSPPVSALCPSCDPYGADRPCYPSSDSSSCISSAESTATEVKGGVAVSGTRRERRRGEAEGVLANWSRRMGLRGRRRCVEMAANALTAFPGAVAVLPFRVCLAASLWLAIKVSDEEGGRGSRTCGGLLKKLELCSGVPAKMIVLAGSRLDRFARRSGAAEEGWAECS